MQARTIKAFDTRNRALFVLTPEEAGQLVKGGCAEWRGKNNNLSVRIDATKPQLIEFVRLMRFQDRDKTTALDSRTHSSDGSANPWKGVQHVRNDAYADHFSVRLNMPIVERV